MVKINCVLVIFGGTGDLANRKLYPAIYNLFADGYLPNNFAVVSVGRRDKNDEILRMEAAESINRFSARNKGDSGTFDRILSRFFYFKLDFDDSIGYYRLNDFLNNIDKSYGTQGNRLFYMAVSPGYFGTIVENIKKVGMVCDEGKSWKRTVIEKPFGYDFKSAAILNRIITESFNEDNIYRIDHYLGKEMLQNIMVIRFANSFFEPLWNNKYIDHIQISSSETVGVENRGEYYESSGALRDMMQNHMLQLLMLVAMEPPVGLDTKSVRDEKVRVLRSLSPMTYEEVKENVVRGQYGRGIVDGINVRGYREEDRVSADSMVETFMAMKVQVENFRWAGVPFYLRTGKRLPRKTIEVSIQFTTLPEILYFKDNKGLKPNRLTIQIQPREGVIMTFNGKKPGAGSEIIPVEMDFCQNCAVGQISPDAYERLIYDAMRGDSTLFTRWDEVEHSWRYMDVISKVWQEDRIDFPNYPAGSWGPEEALHLIERDGRQWNN